MPSSTWGQLGACAQAAQSLRDLLAGADQHIGELDGLLHRRFHAVEPEQGCGVLGSSGARAPSETS